jgi:hypothetical protein
VPKIKIDCISLVDCCADPEAAGARMACVRVHVALIPVLKLPYPLSCLRNCCDNTDISIIAPPRGIRISTHGQPNTG